MNRVSTSAAANAPSHELRYANRFSSAKGFAFPCDASGQVDIDSLNERSRDNYFYARAVAGLEFLFPVVCSAAEAMVSA
jgi:hypothetical protein